MTRKPEGRAVVYCRGAFNTTNGKTAHGLVRRSERYDVAAVIDGTWAGRDAGEVLTNFREITARAMRMRPDAYIAGCLVQ
ncbi:hypothetical protein KKG45_03790, partial [bacterium]|nr:hypothetical protein [bacterium]